MNDSRTKNTVRNAISGIINRVVSIVLPFINRTIIIYTLGIEFTGISSLFTSILSVLSLAELGFNTAVVYSMYKPVANNDKNKICELLTLFKRVYYYVGNVILICGLAILPYIPKLINGNIPSEVNIYVIYLLYLLNTVISYFLFAYKESILLAHQRDDISKNVRTKTAILQYAFQAFTLIIWHNYYLFLIISIISTILTNILLAKATTKYFPEYKCIKDRKRITIPKEMKKNIGGLFIGSIGDQTRNSLDSIILSTLLGLTMVGIYNNYYYIYSSLYGIMLVICNAMSASVGNAIVTETKEKNYNDLLKFSFIIAWSSGWIGICMLCLYQPFMKVWVGENFLLSDFNMTLFCIYFYAINMNNIRNQYSSGSGLWWKMKYTFILEAISNLILNILLGKLLGITGILLATIITIFGFNFISRTIILFKEYFKTQSLKRFLMKHLYWFICIIFASLSTYLFCTLIKVDGFEKIIINAIICLIMPNIILWLTFRKSNEYVETKEFIMSFIKISKMKNI